MSVQNLNPWKSACKIRATHDQECESRRLLWLIAEYTNLKGNVSKEVQSDSIGCEIHENMTKISSDSNHRFARIGPQIA